MSDLENVIYGYIEQESRGYYPKPYDVLRYTLAVKVAQEINKVLTTGEITEDNYKAYVDNLIKTLGEEYNIPQAPGIRLRRKIPTSSSDKTETGILQPNVQDKEGKQPGEKENVPIVESTKQRYILPLIVSLLIGIIGYGGYEGWKKYTSGGTPISGVTEKTHNVKTRKESKEYYNSDDELKKDIKGTEFFSHNSTKRIRPDQLKKLKERGIKKIYLRYEIREEPYEMFKDFQIFFGNSHFKNVDFITAYDQKEFEQMGGIHNGFQPTDQYLSALFANKKIKDITLHDIINQQQLNKLVPFLKKTNKNVRIYGRNITYSQKFSDNIRIFSYQTSF